jgi:hypothetical protein
VLVFVSLKKLEDLMMTRESRLLLQDTLMINLLN